MLGPSHRIKDGERFMAGWGHVIILAPVPGAHGRGCVAEDPDAKAQSC